MIHFKIFEEHKTDLRKARLHNIYAALTSIVTPECHTFSSLYPDFIKAARARGVELPEDAGNLVEDVFRAQTYFSTLGEEKGGRDYSKGPQRKRLRRLPPSISTPVSSALDMLANVADKSEVVRGI